MNRIQFFSPAPWPANEAARQAAVETYRLAEAGKDPDLQAIVESAALLFDTPNAAMSILDGDIQRLFVRLGFDVEQTPRATSFCGHVILAPDRVTVVDDPTRDPRFSGNPVVQDEPYIRFYVGAPLVTTQGVLGALCVFDSRPHCVDEAQRAWLMELAGHAVALLDSRYR
ncbi:diguanylate cyclase [Sphingomonas oleivorans]|uniref:Diguanylate cyclase n=1 Tax=Sphingomonas oleivorans TaxID=1735121 RepID=A0A2T5FTE4_9SPHN|nr:GAF domain-containing protein [Sphingomonas oleivorans]PTQ07337.1 diguanylate cyclase [Sphingomonas oleivorans]